MHRPSHHAVVSASFRGPLALAQKFYAHAVLCLAAGELCHHRAMSQAFVQCVAAETSSSSIGVCPLLMYACEDVSEPSRVRGLLRRSGRRRCCGLLRLNGRGCLAPVAWASVWRGALQRWPRGHSRNVHATSRLRGRSLGGRSLQGRSLWAVACGAAPCWAVDGVAVACGVAGRAAACGAIAGGPVAGGAVDVLAAAESPRLPARGRGSPRFFHLRMPSCVRMPLPLRASPRYTSAPRHLDTTTTSATRRKR